MPDNKRMSELETAATLNGTDLFEIAQVNAGSSSGYASAKTTMNAVGNQLLNGTQYGELQTMSKNPIGAINEVAQSAGNPNIADEYDDTATYVLDDYCIYEGVLYKCIMAVSVAEDFDSTKWDAVLVTDELSQWTEVTGTLTAGNTNITLSDVSITSNSTIDVYTNLDVDYNTITVSTGSVIITFDAQQSNMNVKVRVS